MRRQRRFKEKMYFPVLCLSRKEVVETIGCDPAMLSYGKMAKIAWELGDQLLQKDYWKKVARVARAVLGEVNDNHQTPLQARNE